MSLGSLRRDARALVRLAKLEYEHGGGVSPSMLRRGFLSNRRYFYPGIEDRSVPFVSDVAVHMHSHRLNTTTGRALVRHKHVFAEALLARGLADFAPETYGLVTRRGLLARSGDAAERLRAQDMVVLKPWVGLGGTAVRLAPAQEVFDLTVRQGQELVVQERLVQHPDLRPINPHALNTARLLTVRLPDGPVVAAASHRWGTERSGAVDNVASGGLTSSVDKETGRLGPATETVHGRQVISHDRHPETGVQVAGVVLPQWAEVRDLALRLMNAFPELDHVGWDIAVTDRGPRVVEGNAGMPALTPFQLSGSFLRDDHLRAFYIRHGMLPARYATWSDPQQSVAQPGAQA